jgi:t-SNARE complex subunit (syntaxin)
MSWGGNETTHGARGNPFGDQESSSSGSRGNPFASSASGQQQGSSSSPAAPSIRSKPPVSPSDLRRGESVAYGMTVEELQSNIQRNLTLIQSSISLNSGMINMIGQPNSDSKSLRSRIRDLLRGIASKITKTGDYLNAMSASDLKKKRRGSGQRAGSIAVRKKLEKDLASLKQTLEDLKKKCELKIRQYPLPEPKNEGNPFGSNNRSDGYGDPPDGSEQQQSIAVSGVNGLISSEGSYVSREQIHARLQEQMLIEGETEVNEVMINERNEAMRKINHDLHEVREIFSDLATMIEDQDEGLETITENVKKSEVAARRGRQQLEKANDAQKKSACALM